MNWIWFLLILIAVIVIIADKQLAKRERQNEQDNSPFQE